MSDRDRPESPSRPAPFGSPTRAAQASSRIDPATNRVVATIRVGPKRACCAEHMSLTATGGTLWVAVPNANEIVRIDPTTNHRRRNTQAPVLAVRIPRRRSEWRLVGRRRLRRHCWPDRHPHEETHGNGARAACGRARARIRLRLGRRHRLGRSRPDRPAYRSADREAPCRRDPVRLGVGFGSIWVNDDNGRVLRIRPTS